MADDDEIEVVEDEYYDPLEVINTVAIAMYNISECSEMTYNRKIEINDDFSDILEQANKLILKQLKQQNRDYDATRRDRKADGGKEKTGNDVGGDKEKT